MQYLSRLADKHFIASFIRRVISSKHYRSITTILDLTRLPPRSSLQLPKVSSATSIPYRYNHRSINLSHHTDSQGTLNGRLPHRSRKRSVPSQARSRSSAFELTRLTSWSESIKRSRTNSMRKRIESGGTKDGTFKPPPSPIFHQLTQSFHSGMRRYPSSPSPFEMPFRTVDRQHGSRKV